MQPKPDKYTLQQISVPLKIGVNVQNNFHLHGNITHLTTFVDAPLIQYGNFAF